LRAPLCQVEPAPCHPLQHQKPQVQGLSICPPVHQRRQGCCHRVAFLNILPRFETRQRYGREPKPELLPPEEVHPVFLFPRDGAASSQVHRDGENGDLVPRPQQGVVLEHPFREIPPPSRLNLDMDEQKLRASIAGMELGDDIRLARASLRKAREGLRVQESERAEIEPGFDLGIEKLQKILQELMQEFLEKLIVCHPHVLPLEERDDKLERKPPGAELRVEFFFKRADGAIGNAWTRAV